MAKKIGARNKMGSFIDALPLEERKKIAAYNQHAVHLLVPEVAVPAPTKAKKSSKTKLWVGTLAFDSNAEMRVYVEDASTHPVVIAHGCIALGTQAHIAPDQINVLEVYPDGTFHGRLVDAKAVWKGGTTPHIEDDFRIKAKWLFKETGLKLSIRMPGGQTYDIIRDDNQSVAREEGSSDHQGDGPANHRDLKEE